MKYKVSKSDIKFLDAFEACSIPVDEFHHKEHIRLAYILLAQTDIDNAYEKLKTSLLNYLEHNGVPSSKFHETMTRAWLLAVKHIMHLSAPSTDSEDFIYRNDIVSNKEVMFTHYSRDLINSSKAREKFIEPDLEPIPTHTTPNNALD